MNLIKRKNIKRAGDFLLLELLFEDSYSETFKGIDVRSNYFVCVRTIRKALFADEKIREAVQNEVNMLANLVHDRILNLETYFESSENCYIVTNFCDKGTLKDKYENSFDSRKVILFFKQILQILKLFHERGMEFGGLEPSDLSLCDHDLQLINMGFITGLDPARLCSPFRAPELNSGCDANFKGDVWTAGQMLFYLLTKKSPTAPSSDAKNWTDAVRIELSVCRPELKDLTLKMLEIDRSKRIKWHEVYDEVIQLESKMEKEGSPGSLLASKISEEPSVDLLINREFYYQIEAKSKYASKIPLLMLEEASQNEVEGSQSSPQNDAKPNYKEPDTICTSISGKIEERGSVVENTVAAANFPGRGDSVLCQNKPNIALPSFIRSRQEIDQSSPPGPTNEIVFNEMEEEETPNQEFEEYINLSSLMRCRRSPERKKPASENMLIYNFPSVSIKTSNLFFRNAKDRSQEGAEAEIERDKLLTDRRRERVKKLGLYLHKRYMHSIKVCGILRRLSTNFGQIKEEVVNFLLMKKVVIMLDKLRSSIEQKLNIFSVSEEQSILNEALEGENAKEVAGIIKNEEVLSSKMFEQTQSRMKHLLMKNHIEPINSLEREEEPDFEKHFLEGIFMVAANLPLDYAEGSSKVSRAMITRTCSEALKCMYPYEFFSFSKDQANFGLYGDFDFESYEKWWNGLEDIQSEYESTMKIVTNLYFQSIK